MTTFSPNDAIVLTHDPTSDAPSVIALSQNTNPSSPTNEEVMTDIFWSAPNAPRELVAEFAKTLATHYKIAFYEETLDI